MSRTIFAICTTFLVLLYASLTNAQSLGDVAKKEGERRQGVVKPSGKVITNQDLPTVPPPSSAPPAAAASDKPDADGSGKADEAEDKNGADKAVRGDAKDEKFWSDRMKQAREQLRQDEMFAEALQSRINGLTADFVNRDDPAQRDQIARERQTAIGELERVKKSVVDRNKAIGSIEEEARRAGVPAGWLR